MATYKGILTNNGKALIAGATVSNKINYSHIAVGDGNGSVPVPSETRTALINEKARIALNVVEINPNNTNQIVCEAIIPSNVGGFYIRELGLYAGNTMVVNASYPPTYKPLADEGGAREIAIKIVINIQNAEVIALYLDDSLIYATREWVNKNYIHRNELIDNLTTDDASKPLTAKQGKVLNDNKLEKTANAVSASKLQTARTISYSGAATGSFNYDGSGNSSCILTLANSGVAAGSYASTIQIPQISVNAAGQITAISQQTIRSASTSQNGIVQLNDTLTSTAIDQALTANQGKTLNDKLNALTDYSLLDKFTLDLTALNKDTYYPVTTTITGKRRVRFIIDTLFSSYQAPWSTHGGGSFSVFADWNEYPDAWGGDTVDRNINSFGYLWSSQSPILGINQMGASSNAVFYARGGTKYDVYVAKGCTPIIRTASYSVNGETVQPIAYNADYVPISIRQQLSADKLDKTATAVAAKKLATEQTSFTNDSDFIQYYKDKSTAFFDNGSGKFFAQYAAGLVSSLMDGGTFIISTDILTGKAKLISCVVRANGTIDYLNKKEFAFTDSDISGNSASSTKLKNTRKIFGLDFDGTNDVAGNITTTTGMVASDSYHYIDMGRSGVDRMNLAVYGGIFNFINAENGNVIARLNSNGIDCNAATATKLQNQRTINGVAFDGTQDITITAEQRLNGGIGNESQLNAALTAGIYVCSSDNGLAGIYGYGFLQVYRSGGVISQVYYPHLTGGSNEVFFAVRQSWDSGQSWGGWYYSGKNADSASKLKTARNIAITGAVSGSANFDGSGNITINTTSNNAIGVGQSWSDVTSSRSSNTTYTNTTGKPIQIMVLTPSWNNAGSFDLLVDGITVMSIGNQDGYNQSKPTSVLIPNGSTYRVNGSFQKWSELR
ncbi:phage tail protein [Acinetobacter nosocomialis]|uniref:phage tail-collar fiber domain-containing protein n=1 Tax=Acinetobacter nosocomialis TaxID=106654 RepID=UPI0032B47D28